MKHQMTLQNKADKRNPKFHGYVIQVAYNPLTRKFEQVFEEDEVSASKVVTMYWSDGKYITVPED